MQMLGSRVLDEDGVEGGTACGLGLLPIETTMRVEKALSQTEATHKPSGLPVSGYEIHHGRTTPRGPVSETVVAASGVTIGYASRDGNVWGTYLHGVFGADAFRRWFVDDLRVRRGLALVGEPLRTYGLEPALDALADAVRTYVDVSRIYRMMGL